MVPHSPSLGRVVTWILNLVLLLVGSGGWADACLACLWCGRVRPRNQGKALREAGGVWRAQAFYAFTLRAGPAARCSARMADARWRRRRLPVRGA